MQRNIIIIVLLLSVALSGCITRLSTKKLDPGGMISLSENEAIVFGKIIFVENNEEKTPYSSCCRGPIISIFHVESSHDMGWWSLEKDGSFYWIVPRGTYIIPDIRYDYSLRPQAAFQVPFSTDAFYLGTLKLDVAMKKIVARHYLKQINSITVTDEFDKAKEVFLQRNPEFTGKIEKNIMIHDKSIPDNRSLYTQRPLIDILNAIGFRVSAQGQLR